MVLDNSPDLTPTGSRSMATALVSRLAGPARSGALARIAYVCFAACTAALSALILWAVLCVLPGGTDSTETAELLRRNHDTVTMVVMTMPVVLIFMLVVGGVISAKLYGADTSTGRWMTWAAFASDLAFTVILSIEVGMMAVANLLADRVSAEIIYTLHVLSFSSAYLLGPIWIPFLGAFVAISVRARLFPTWLNLLAASTIVTNGCAWLVALSLSGPVNGQNGLIGLGVAAVGPVVFLLMTMAHIVASDLPAAILRRVDAGGS